MKTTTLVIVSDWPSLLELVQIRHGSRSKGEHIGIVGHHFYRQDVLFITTAPLKH